jgi:hypothetical protein
MAPEELPELPNAWDYAYEWDNPFGVRRSFDYHPHNGVKPDRHVSLFTEDQMHAYVLADRAARQEAAPAGWQAERDSMLRVRIMQGDAIANHVIAMQAALLEWYGSGTADSGMQWIENTLAGPGFLPDMKEAAELGGAQAWFDAKMAEHEAFRAANPGPAPAPATQQAQATCKDGLQVPAMQQAAGDAERDAAPERVFSTSDDEGFSDDFSSMVDSLLTQHEKLTPGLVYYVGDKREFAPSDFMRGVGGTILEYARDQAWQEVDEWSEDFANRVKPEAMAELQAVVNAWADKHLRVTFWGVKNIREATITEQDVADHAHLWADAAIAQADQDTAPGAEKGALRNSVWKRP